MESVEITAGSVKEALEKGLEQLGIAEEDCVYEVIRESGLIKKKYTVKVTEKPKGEKKALEFIRGVIKRMDLDCTVELKSTDDGFLYEISGNDVAHIIGYRGDVLDSLQYLALLVANTVEGFVPLESFTDAHYRFDGAVSQVDETTGRRLTIGQELPVLSASADVSSGRIDFVYDPQK